MSQIPQLRQIIETAYDKRDSLPSVLPAELMCAINSTLELLDSGKIRAATRGEDGNWHVETWVKQAVLLSFKSSATQLIDGGPASAPWWDKVMPKTFNWTEADFEAGGFRYVPGAVVRRGAFIGKNVVLMPCFVNIGAYVGQGSMIDTWATIGSCAQIGEGVHVSGGTGIGGVLEPLNARPVILEDNVFVGARSEIAEGVIVRQGSVIAMGCFIGASTRIVNRSTGEIYYGEVPANSVVVPATMPAPNNADGSPCPSLACVAIVKTVDERTRSKTAITELLRY